MCYLRSISISLMAHILTCSKSYHTEKTGWSRQHTFLLIQRIGSVRGDPPIFTKNQLPKTEIRPGLPILDFQGDTFFSGKFLVPIATVGCLTEI